MVEAMQSMKKSAQKVELDQKINWQFAPNTAQHSERTDEAMELDVYGPSLAPRFRDAQCEHSSDPNGGSVHVTPLGRSANTLKSTFKKGKSQIQKGANLEKAARCGYDNLCDHFEILNRSILYPRTKVGILRIQYGHAAAASTEISFRRDNLKKYFS